MRCSISFGPLLTLNQIFELGIKVEIVAKSVKVIKDSLNTKWDFYLWRVAEIAHNFSNVLNNGYIILPAVVPKLGC